VDRGKVEPVSDPNTEEPAPEVDIEDFFDAWETGAAVLDVRNPHEYVQKRIPGVTLIPLGELLDRLNDVPEGRPLYVVCGSGPRSLKAATYLRNHLDIDAINVAGGTNAWAEAGHPLESG
jgi:rhodanese-related sulfurtransferase